MSKMIFRMKRLLLKFLLKFYSEKDMWDVYRYYKKSISAKSVSFKIKITSFFMRFLAPFFDFDHIAIKLRRVLPSKAVHTAAEELYANNFSAMSPINVLHSTSGLLRVNLLIDSLTEDSIFGGVCTSIIFANILAHQLKVSLRIITRDPYSSLRHYKRIIEIYDLPKLDEVSLVNFKCLHDENKLEVSKKDLFISTSWWSSYVIKKINMRRKFVYLLQEYESIFYPKGDETFLAENIFHDQDIIYVVNTKVLHDYFVINGYKQIEKNGLYFEPAFPGELYKPNESAFSAKTKLNLMFYARPQHSRNMFYTGLRLIDLAIEKNILDTSRMNIFFSGASFIPDFKFIDSSQPKKLGKMIYEDYLATISNIDVGIALMMAPCPGYVPLDLASFGGVCLTTQYANKIKLDYSDNIVYSELNFEALLCNLEKCIELANNLNKREENYKNNKISQSWPKSFENTITAIEVMLRTDQI